MLGGEGGSIGIDDCFVKCSFENVGVWIFGCNMFGLVCGFWFDDSWKGWWGDNLFYYVLVFVLIYYVWLLLEMVGGMIFYFVIDGIEVVLKCVKVVVVGWDVCIGGGVLMIC